MLPAAALPVILVADHDRADALRFVPAGDLRYGKPRFARQDIRALAWLGRKCIVRPKEHIVADLVQMASELEPGSCRRNVIGRRLAFGLDQQGKFLEILAVPARKWLQQLQPIAGRRDFDGQFLAVGCWRNKPFLPLRETLGWKFFSLRPLELEFLAIRSLKLLIDRIKGQITRDGIGGHNFRAREE